MAAILRRGWELNSVTAGVEFDTIIASPTISSTTVRSGVYAGRVNSISSGVATGFGLTVQSSIGAATSYYTRVYVRLAALPNADTSIVLFTNGATMGLNVKLRATGAIALYNGVTQVGSDSATLLATGTWYRIELHHDDTGSAGAHVGELRLNGTTTASSTTLTIGGHAPILRVGANLMTADTGTSIDIFFDDLALNDTSGTASTSWVGDSKLSIYVPSGPGDNFGWTANGPNAPFNYNCVNELPPDDATNYVNRSGQPIDDHAVAVKGTGPSANDSIILVQIEIRGGATSASDVAARRVQTRLKSASGGTVSTSATDAEKMNVNGWVTNTTASPALPNLISYLDPTTGVPWKATGTNSLANMQIGYIPQTSAVTELRVTTVWAYVEWFSAPTDADTAATVDGGEAVAATLTDADTAAVANAESISGQPSDTDTASTVDDGATIAAAVTDADTASTVDAEATTWQTTDADTGSTAEGEAIAAAVTDSDTASAADGGEAIAASVSDADTASTLEAETISTAVTDADTASILDSEGVASALSDDDPASTTDAEAISATVTDSETASGTDGGEAVVAALTDADTASISDGGEAVANAVSDDDPATGVDAGETIAATITDTESASTTDGGEAIAATVTDTDVATTAELEAVGTGISDDDPAIITETETVASAITDADTAAAVDAEAVATGPTDTDPATIVDLEAILASLTDDDPVVVTEFAGISISLTESDLALLSEGAAVLALVGSSDACHVFEAESVSGVPTVTIGWLVGEIRL